MVPTAYPMLNLISSRSDTAALDDDGGAWYPFVRLPTVLRQVMSTLGGMLVLRGSVNQRVMTGWTRPNSSCEDVAVAMMEVRLNCEPATRTIL